MNKKERRKKERRKAAACIALLSLLAVLIVCLFIVIGKSSVKAEAAEGEKYYKSIEIEKGDTLSGIAAEYGCSVEELMQINNLENNVIYAGESIIVSYTKQ